MLISDASQNRVHASDVGGSSTRPHCSHRYCRVHSMARARSRSVFGTVSAARLQRTAIVDLQNLILDAETGQRGYLLTGNPAYLKPYLEARQNSEAQLAGLMSIMNGDPLQKADTSKLAPIITAKLVELQQTIDLANANKRDEALARVKTNFGQALMAQARQLFSMMLQRSEERVDAAVRDEQQSISTLRMGHDLRGDIHC